MRTRRRYARSLFSFIFLVFGAIAHCFFRKRPSNNQLPRSPSLRNRKLPKQRKKKTIRMTRNSKEKEKEKRTRKMKTKMRARAKARTKKTFPSLICPTTNERM